MQQNSSLPQLTKAATEAPAQPSPIRRFSIARLPLSGRPVVIAAKAS